MVVGEAGLGKTTLLESFFKSFKDDEAAFALFERKETATEIETRRQLTEAQVQRNAAERELQAAIEKANYTIAHAKQREIAQLTESMVIISERLKELSAADERRRNELRCLREATRVHPPYPSSLPRSARPTAASSRLLPVPPRAELSNLPLAPTARPRRCAWR